MLLLGLLVAGCQLNHPAGVLGQGSSPIRPKTLAITT